MQSTLSNSPLQIGLRTKPEHRDRSVLLEESELVVRRARELAQLTVEVAEKVGMRKRWLRVEEGGSRAGMRDFEGWTKARREGELENASRAEGGRVELT